MRDEIMSDAGEGKRRWGWGRVVLIASLALNLAVAGVVAGAALRFGGDWHDRRSGDFSVPYIRALSPTDRRAIGKELRRAHDVAATGIAARGALFTQMSEALRADSFDLARVEELSLQQRTAVTRRMSSAQNVWLRYVGDMSAEERSDYADRIDEALARGPHRRNKR
jgi:uncharacterized membrane protein